MRSFAVLVGALALACGGDRLVPYSADELRAVILVEPGADTPRATAYTIAEDAPLRLAGEAGTYLLGYDAPLEAMRLRAGPLTVGAEGAPIPAPLHTARFDGEAWSTLTAPPPEIAALRVGREPVCTSFDVEERPFPLGADESVTFALTLDSTRALAATTAGRFFVVTATASWQLTALSTSTPHLTGLVHEGELWLLGPGTRVVHGTLERGFVDAPPLPFEIFDSDAMVDGPHGGAPFELFVTDQSLAVAHFDGARWRKLRDGPRIDDVTILRAGIGWVEPGLAVLLGPRVDGVVELRSNGEERFVPIELPLQSTPDTVWSSAWIEGRGRLLGSRYGVIHQRDQGRWIRMPVVRELSQRIDVFVDLRDGTFLAGGQLGSYAQWGPGEEHCPRVLQIGRESAREVALLGDGFARFPFAAVDHSVFVVTRARP